MRSRSCAPAPLAGLILLLATCGCAHLDERVVGKWTYDHAITGGGPADMPPGAIRTDTALQFGPDGSFTLTTGGQPAIGGRWSSSGNDVTISPTSYNGRSIAELKAEAESKASQYPRSSQEAAHLSDDINASLSPDGKQLTLKAPVGKTAGMVYAKAPG